MLTPLREDVDHGHGRQRSAVDHVLPASGSIMKDRKPVKGGGDINAEGLRVRRKIYPKEAGGARAASHRLPSRGREPRRWRTTTSTPST